MRSVQFYRTLLRQDIEWKNQCAMLEYHNRTVEVEEYDWTTASLELVLCAIRHGFYPMIGKG